MNTLYSVSMHLNNLSSALRVAIRWNSKEKILEVMSRCTDIALRKQFCFMLGRHRYNYLKYFLIILDYLLMIIIFLKMIMKFYQIQDFQNFS